MRRRKLACATISALFLMAWQSGVAATDCPRTVGSDTEYVDSWPHANTWFGTKGFAVKLPEHGVWPTTAPGHSLAVKLFWYVAGFKPGQESEFTASVKRLDQGENDAVITEPTNAGGPNLGAWTVLTGIDFPSPGCWELRGEFRGRSLTFIVETVSYLEWPGHAM